MRLVAASGLQAAPGLRVGGSDLDVVGDLANSIEVAQHTNFNGDPVYLLSESIVTTVTGNEPGTGGGMRSGVNKGKVRATSSSTTVRVEKKFVVRHGDECDMNLAS